MKNQLLFIIIAFLFVACEGTNQLLVLPSTDSKSQASHEDEASPADLDVIANTLIQLRDPLDEPEYYCVDVPGFGRSLNLQGALTAHTCKPNAEDELFTFHHPSSGQIYMDAYDLCMQAVNTESGYELQLQECSNSSLQYFTYTEDGTIRLQNADSEVALCLTVAAGEGEPTGGPSHLRRDLMLQPCATVDPVFSLWAMPGPTLP